MAKANIVYIPLVSCGGAFIGLGLVSIDREFFGYKILGTIISIYFILLGLYYIVSYFLGDKNCPLCSEIDIASPKPQKPFNGNRVCSNCYYIDNLTSRKKLNKYGSIFLIAFGLLGIIPLTLNETTLEAASVKLLGYLILLSLGIYGLSTNFIYNYSCRQCGNKEMLALDNPEAINLIKQYDFRPGENPAPNQKS